MSEPFDIFPIKVSLSPRTAADAERLLPALDALMAEGVRFAFRRDIRTGATWLYGESEYALDLLLGNLIRAQGIGLHVGAPQIPYRASIRGPAEESFTQDRSDRGQRHAARVSLRVSPEGRELPGRFSLPEGLPPRRLAGLRSGIQSVLSEGPLEGFPLYGLRVEIIEAEELSPDTTPLAFEIAARMALRQAVRAAGTVMLEPIMRADIHAPAPDSAAVVADLQTRRGEIIALHAEDNLHVRIEAEVPMANMLGYLTALFNATGARGRFTMALAHYREVPMSQGPDDAPPMAMAL